MTDAPRLVWDTTGPAYAGACGHLDWLLECAGVEREHLLPSEVLVEIQDLGVQVDQELFEVVDCNELDSLEDILRLERWLRVLGVEVSSGHNLGEAYTATIAEKKRAVAIIDDRLARKVIEKQRGPATHGVLWAIARALVEGRKDSPTAVSGLVDAMLAVSTAQLGQLRWPINRGGFARWYAEHEQELARV